MSTVSTVVSALAVSLNQRFLLRSSTPIELVASPESTTRRAAKPNSLGRGFVATPSAVTFRTALASMNPSTMLNDPLSKVHASQWFLCESVTLPSFRCVIYVSDMRFYGRTKESFSEFCCSMEPSCRGPFDAARPIRLAAGTSTKNVTRTLGRKAHCAGREFLVISGCLRRLKVKSSDEAGLE